ncbi:MAG: biopolymer transporter ExbD [Verrucomicrobiota bacterium]|nr:biopolymer transporter ExbD [Verrucomicrobiota bacterium]
MHFYVRKRRTTPAVIIVALIDVLIVLLIFLMVTTTFKQQPALRLALPVSTQAKKAGANEAPPLVVSIESNGVFYLEKLPVTFEQLKSRLVSDAAKNPKLKLAVRADENAPVGRMVQVMDAAKEAHIKSSISLFTREPPHH